MSDLLGALFVGLFSFIIGGYCGFYAAKLLLKPKIDYFDEKYREAEKYFRSKEKRND